MALLLPTAAACARGRHVEPLPYVELVTGGAAADAELPLILALHGRGDTAEDFATLFRGFAVPARVAVLRPPHPWGSGQAWFLGARAGVKACATWRHKGSRKREAGSWKLEAVSARP